MTTDVRTILINTALGRRRLQPWLRPVRGENDYYSVFVDGRDFSTYTELREWCRGTRPPKIDGLNYLGERRAELTHLLTGNRLIFHYHDSTIEVCQTRNDSALHVIVHSPHSLVPTNNARPRLNEFMDRVKYDFKRRKK